MSRVPRLILATLILAGLPSCGGGSSGSDEPSTGNTQPSPFLVISTTPASGAGGVARPAPVTVTFSRSVSAASVTAARFTLTTSSGPVGGFIVAVSSSATFWPTDPMPPLTVYTAKVSKDVSDNAGKKLGADHTWTFTTMGVRWSPPEALNVTDEDVQDHDVAINADGQSVVSWLEGDSVRSTYAAVQMSFTAGWTEATRLDDGDYASDINPKAGIDGDGNATVVWYDDFDYGRVRSRRRLASGSWQSVVPLEDAAYDLVPTLRLKVAPDGRALVMYRAISSNPNAIPPSPYWREYLPLSGWQPRGQGAPIGYAGEDNSDLVMNESGQLAALFALTLVNSAGDAMRAMDYDGDWNQQQTLLLADLPDRPRATMDGNGGLLAVWRQSEDDDVLVAASCTLGSGWDVLASFTPAGPLAEPHAVAGDGAGNALLLWTETVGGLETLRHVRYRASNQQWGAEFADPQHSGDISGAQLAMAPNGIAFAAWAEQIGARRVIRASQYTDGGGWSSPVTIASDPTLDCFNPRLAVSSDGTATVAFLRGDNSQTDLMVSRFE